MTTLRNAILWCLRLEIPWTSDDVAAMASSAPSAVRAYLTTLAQRDVVRRVEGGWIAGGRKAVRAFRRARPRTEAGGRSIAYKQARAIRDRLLSAEAQARRGGLLTSKSYQPLSESPKSTQEETPMLEGSGLSVSEAAKALAVSVGTIRNWDKAGYIKCGRTPTNQRRVPESEIVRLRGTILLDQQQPKEGK